MVIKEYDWRILKIKLILYMTFEIIPVIISRTEICIILVEKYE